MLSEVVPFFRCGRPTFNNQNKTKQTKKKEVWEW